MGKNQNQNQNQNRNNNQGNQIKKKPNFNNDQLGENMNEFSEEVNPNNAQKKKQNNNNNNNNR